MTTRQPGSKETQASLWGFALRSFVRQYGWLFAWKVAVRHPWRTLRAVRKADRIDVTAGGVDVSGGETTSAVAGPPSIVGAGFCLKPITPPCPSGRANHDCALLERLTERDAAGVAAPCRLCAIGEIGTRSLLAGSAFYVMTSARDILQDVYVPALEAGRFPTGLFVLCRYSFKPFAVGLLASGISARLLPLDQGDCRDYRTWLLADRGIKDQQTTMDGTAMAGLASQIGRPAPWQALTVERRGNVLHPVAGRPVARHAVGPL